MTVLVAGLLLALVATVGASHAFASTSVRLGNSDAQGPLTIDPSTSPSDPLDAAGQNAVAFIVSMPRTVVVDHVTLGDFADGTGCSAHAQLQLIVDEVPSGSPGGSSSIVAQSAGLVDTPAALGKMTWPLNVTLLLGHSYLFRVQNYGACSTYLQRTWAHNGPTVDGGSQSCESGPYVDNGGAGGFKRQWHVHNVQDSDPVCQQSSFDATLPTGWLVSFIPGSSWHVLAGQYNVRDPGTHIPGDACVTYFRDLNGVGGVPVAWPEGNVYDAQGLLAVGLSCAWSQYADYGTHVPDGWYYGLPWTSARTGAPRDAYLRLYGFGLGPVASELFGDGRYEGSSPNLCSVCHGDPVNDATGNFSEAQSDLAIGGLGVGLDVRRTYNAQAAATATAPGPMGYGWTSTFRQKLTADAAAGTVTIVQSDGSTVTFIDRGNGTYDAPGWVQSSLVHNGDGTWTYTLPDQRTMKFDSAGRLLSIADANANTTTMAYDGSGNLTTVTDPTARHLTFTYNADGTVATVTSPRGRVVSYGYDAGKNLTSVTDVNLGVWHFAYDSRHRMTSMKDPRNGETVNVYDAQDRVTSQKDPMLRETIWDYSTPGVTKVTDPAGHQTQTTFTNNLPTTVITAKGTADEATKTMSYDSAGNLKKVTDARQHDWTYTYDGAGNRLTATTPQNRTTSWTYNSHRDVLTETKPSGLLTTYAYDANDNLTSLTRTLTETGTQQQTLFTYNALGQLTKKTDPLTHFWAYTYDANGNLASKTSPLGFKTTYVYDLDGFLSSSVAPRGNVSGGTPATYRTTYARNAFGDPTTITDPRGKTTIYAYDLNRNRTDETDRDARHSVTVFDADNEPTQVTRGDGSIVKTAYTSTGRVASQTDGLGRATTYAYDAQDRVASVTDPKGRVTSSGYDATGNRTTLTDPSARVTTSTYDSANHLTGVHYSTGSPADVTLDYTADGQRHTMSDESGTSTWAYDSLDRLKSFTNGQSRTTSYTYDLADNQKTVAYPPALVPGPPGTTPTTVTTGTVTRAYDNDDRLLTVTDWLTHTTSYAYNQDGVITSITRPDGTKSTNTVDVNDALTKISDTKSGGFSFVATYTRTNGELLKTQTETGASAQPNPTYTYDAVARLTSTGATAGQTYAYDNADNPTKIVRASVTANQIFDTANQLTSTTNASSQTTASLGYDAQGSRTSLTPTSGLATTYAYDQALQLRTYTGPDTAGAALTQTYGYDGTGTRTYTQASGTRTYQTWDVSTELPLIIEDGSSSYIYGAEGVPIEQILSGGTVRYLHHDQLGSIRALTDQSAATVATYNYDPYGKQLATTGTASNPFRYAGQYTDPSGLQYLRARYYDPTTAQFLTRDPAVAETRQAYAYAAGSPVNATDPSGLVFGIPGTPSWSEVGTRFVGFWDGFTLGGTAALRGALGLNGGLDTCSADYRLARSIGGGTALVETQVATFGAGALPLSADVSSVLARYRTVALGAAPKLSYWAYRSAVRAGSSPSNLEKVAYLLRLLGG